MTVERENSDMPRATVADQAAVDVVVPLTPSLWQMLRDGMVRALCLARRLRVPLSIVLSLTLLVAGWTPQLAPSTAYAFDKIIHLAAFGGFTFLMVLLFGRPVIIGLAVAALSGLIEIGQEFVPGRSAGWDDLLANFVGILVALGLAWALRRTRVFGGVS